jgi:hypothetical protein
VLPPGAVAQKLVLLGGRLWGRVRPELTPLPCLKTWVCAGWDVCCGCRWATGAGSTWLPFRGALGSSAAGLARWRFSAGCVCGEPTRFLLAVFCRACRYRERKSSLQRAAGRRAGGGGGGGGTVRSRMGRTIAGSWPC